MAEQTIPIDEYVVTVVVQHDDPLATSGIRGSVTLGPQCPVLRDDEPCPDKPYEATLIVLDGRGKQIATIRSGPDGNYALSLPPGSFRILPQTPPDNPFPIADAIDVVLEEGVWTVVGISYDTGIR